MVEIRNLSVGYPGHPVLGKVSLHIPAGAVTAIVGPNGCGKSTLLKALAGMLPRSSGEITVAGKPIGAYTSQELARQIAFLPQGKAVPGITAGKLVLHGRFPYLGYPRHYGRQDLAIAKAAMERMGIAHLADIPVAQLSGGTRQKVYIAMALAQDTPVILMDEPTTYLDMARQLRLMDQARDLADEGKAVVLVLHDLGLAMATADQVIVLANGQVAAAGDPETVFVTGCLDRVFGIGVRRFESEDGWQYYYRRQEEQ